MKILVLSDSHGVFRYMEQAVMAERPDYMIHLGDKERDAEELSSRFQEIPLISVCGNCDSFSALQPLTKFIRLDGVRFMITHGHLYGVKEGLLRLELAAREGAAEVALFGHTHQAYCEKNDGRWLLNPGACGGSGKVSYGLVLVDNGDIMCYNVAIK